MKIEKSTYETWQKHKFLIISRNIAQKLKQKIVF